MKVRELSRVASQVFILVSRWRIRPFVEDTFLSRKSRLEVADEVRLPTDIPTKQVFAKAICPVIYSD